MSLIYYIIPFPCSDQAAFHSFVSCITASGGGDAPEDIMGGLKVAFSSLSWRDGGAKVSVEELYYYV